MAASTLGRASIPFFACACLLLVLVLQILSFASPHWAKDDKSDFGLWRYARCMETNTVNGLNTGCYKLRYSWQVEEWLDAVRGLECLAIVFWAFPIVIVPVYLYVALGLNYRCVMASMTTLTLFGSLCNITGVIIFGIKIDDHSSWDFRWCIVVSGCAGVLSIVSFILFFISICFRPVFSSNTHLMSGLYVDPDRNKMYVVENIDDMKPGPLDGGHINPAME